tara:strand:- start:734 stop:1327 length:594 start_codon:yes stop_codon:yes gene_type:complete
MADLLDKLTDTIRSGSIGKATKRSARWFQDKIKGLKGGLRNRFSSTNPDKFYRESDNKIQPAVMAKRASLGDLFCYHYDPKYKATLPYYDMFPMIMLIGVESDTFLGLNFHYLAPKLRAILLDRVNAKIAGGVPNWKKISKIPLVEPAVHRYRFDHISRKVIQIEKEEEEIAIFLPLERFRKASKSAVWGASKRRIG